LGGFRAWWSIPSSRFGWIFISRESRRPFQFLTQPERDPLVRGLLCLENWLLNISRAHQPGRIGLSKNRERKRDPLFQTSTLLGLDEPSGFLFSFPRLITSHIETQSLCVDHGGDMQIKRMNDAHLGLVIHFLSEL